eukprot:1627294-Rhodomonas_salina.6
MAAVAVQAVQAAQAAAAAEQAVNQAAILQQIADTQQFLRQQLEERDSKNKQSDCPKGLAAYNPWVLTVESFLAKKPSYWVLQLTDAGMTGHPNYPPDPPLGPDPVANAAAQLEVLIKLCSQVYYKECTTIKRDFTNCGTMLWRQIYIANNPNGEAQTNSLRAALKMHIAKFQGEWKAWIQSLETISVQLERLGEPFTDCEFHEQSTASYKCVPGFCRKQINFSSKSFGLRKSSQAECGGSFLQI